MNYRINIDDNEPEAVQIPVSLSPVDKEIVINKFGLWAGLIISFFLLVLGISITWYCLVGKEFIPYVWLFIANVFLVLSYLLFEKTRRAYLCQRWQVVTLSAVTAYFIGTTLFILGIVNRVIH